ncbi:MAG: DegT/DnrJ/EryC1/StrS family aminotransferase [Reichenbachiella sp.]|uniref:DegT/DnrJ/EryC1/StrS family aminotransferase n=1 Tax=Reichenbachiella sp. TaxID=2184521 RepID=UPI0032648CE0
MEERIYLSSPHQTGEESEALQRVLKSNWLAPVGPDLNEFEQKISEATGFKYAVATSSGTAAIHLGLQILGVTPRDHVMASTMTFIGAVNPILYQNAKPIFIDSESDSWNIDVELVKKYLLTESLKVKAILPTYLYGMPAGAIELEALGKTKGIAVLHDLAECFAGKVKGEQMGQFLTRGILSFNGNKLITTSGGGAFVTNIKEEADMALYLATQAKSESVAYHHEQIGYNYRMSNVLAALGIAQIKGLEHKVESKKAIFECYKRELSPLGLKFQHQPEGVESDRWLTAVLLDQGMQISIDEVVQKMNHQNIEVRPIWKPMHLQPVFHDESICGGQVSESLFARGLCLPSGCGLMAEQQMRVIETLKSTIFNH